MAGSLFSDRRGMMGNDNGYDVWSCSSHLSIRGTKHVDVKVGRAEC